MPKKAKLITSRGALLVVDLEAADRAWSTLPASQVLEGIRAGSLAPRAPSRTPPAPPGEKKNTGLDVALAAFTMKKLLAMPLADGLKAKRALGIPWRWLWRAPDAKEEARTDDRLLKWAEISRVADLTADEIMGVASAVEREMIGAAEVKDAFARWGTPEFAAKIAALRDADVPAALEEAWGDLAPLMAALGHDEEHELVTAVTTRVREVREMLAFATAEKYAVLPYLKERWDDFLASRAAARAR